METDTKINNIQYTPKKVHVLYKQNVYETNHNGFVSIVFAY